MDSLDKDERLNDLLFQDSFPPGRTALNGPIRRQASIETPLTTMA